MAEAEARRSRLFRLLEAARSKGARFARVSEVDGLVERGAPAIYLKHDVHALCLHSLTEFARRERGLGILGSYFFMAPDHPLTRPCYTFAQQARAMRLIRSMGHEIGLHIDPFFLMDCLRMPLPRLLKGVLARFRDEGLQLRVGNLHGNSGFRMLDRNGFETSFDLFREVGRQPDYPVLADLPEETARLIRSSRVSLHEHGFRHWADMPMWSARHGLVVTSYLSDNYLGRRGTLRILVHGDAVARYKLADRQPPHSLAPVAARRYVPC
ncbi:MAG: hypothetical protein V3T83_10360, partial [Acidobacteriota bacterium]